ncbi:MAG TPA: type IX secretion system sortase PorU, partial [Bacteroidetes bacterium]|nr:type IX secretion system sortase PorU [Bacteroidota bacterium]
PVYETKRSLDPINSFPSDDYFGLISYGEGKNLSGKLDISIGRMPVRTAEQADIIVNKIINYETNKEYYGAWKNNITLCADDVDEEWDITHIKGAESINYNLLNKYPTFNINKIYLDAFIQENNTGGQRYPEANKAINSSVFNGELMFVYVGHGGPKGLAQERVLQKDDINSWNNKTKLPLLITATCSFTGFDDPKVNTAGEVAFLKEKGGVIGLFSTVRAVYSSSNDALMRSTFNAFFSPESNRFLPLGDIIRIAKNNTSGLENKRKFLLFGDPSMNLNFPKYNVKTTKINNKIITNDSVIIDTLSALEAVNIEGMIIDKNYELVNDFNGEIDITLFDKPTKLKTFANDFEGKESLRKEFYLQKNILFKGTAKVENGKFSLNFILPKDINYKYGQGKISYYAIADNLEKAAGYNNNISIGGTANNLISDKEGPQIQLYMNDTGFAYGGITDRNPVLLGFLEDESGINITGIGIGHELSAEMDNNSGNKIILNEFYESEMNNFRKGSFRYPLSKLEPGKHLIKVEAWDILNNRSEKIIEFIAVDGNSEKLKHVLNYPNPFSSMTNFRFEHDLPDQELDIAVNIYSMSGKIVKSISLNKTSPGYQISDISWDGTDDYGNRLANGIYIYKIKVFSPEYNISRESKFEKLVILR